MFQKSKTITLLKGEQNLTDEISYKKDIVSKKLLSVLPINQQDLWMYIHNDDLFSITLKARILYYSESNPALTTSDISKIWIGCECYPFDVVLNKVGLEGFAKMLKEDYISLIDIKPFGDQDAYFGMFSKKDNGAYSRITFYLNPYYENGYWENHTL